MPIIPISSVVTFLLLLSFNFFSTKAQVRLNSKFSLDTVIYFPEVEYYSQPHTIGNYFQSSIKNDTLSFVMVKPLKDTLRVFMLDIKSFKYSSKLIVFPHAMIDYISRHHLIGLHKSGQILSLIFSRSIIRFKELNTCFIFDTYSSLDRDFSFFKSVNDSVGIFGRRIYELKDSSSRNSELMLFDFQSMSKIKSIKPEYIQPEWDIFHSKTFDQNGTLIAHSHFYDYRIDLYNYNLLTIDSIKYSPKWWKNLPNDSIENAKREIPDESKSKSYEFLLALDRRRELYQLTRIDQIFFLSPKQLLVQYSYYDSLKRRNFKVDIWERKDAGSWILIEDGLIDQKHSNELVISNNDYPLNLWGGPVFVFNDKLLFKIEPNIDQYPIGLTLGEYYRRYHLYKEEKELILNIAIFRYTGAD